MVQHIFLAKVKDYPIILTELEVIVESPRVDVSGCRFGEGMVLSCPDIGESDFTSPTMNLTRIQQQT